MNKPLVTIIITTYNNENSIVATVESILDQTYDNIEIIVIDTGSFDCTVSLLEKYVKQYKKMRIFIDFLLDPIDAQKTALLRAKGKYISFVESGKILSQNYIEYAVSTIEKYNSQILVSEYFSVPVSAFFNQENLDRKSPAEEIHLCTNTEYMKNVYSKSKHTYQMATILWNKLIDKTWLLSTPYIHSSLPLLISYEIIKHDCKIATSNQCLICEIQFDKYFIDRCFNYESLENIKFLESLLVGYKKEKNELAMYHTALRLFKYLLKIRRQLSFYCLELPDKKELKKSTDLKFNSIYKFLIAKFGYNKLEYETYNREYRELVKFERFRNENFYLFPYYTVDYPTELY